MVSTANSVGQTHQIRMHQNTLDFLKKVLGGGPPKPHCGEPGALSIESNVLVRVHLALCQWSLKNLAKKKLKVKKALPTV